MREPSIFKQANHDGLRAWTRGTQALIAEWSRRPADATTFARAGRRYARGPDAPRPASGDRSAQHARLGNRDAARAALQEAWRARDVPERTDEVAALGGVLPFPQ
ncbi:hypothetical protein K1T35_48035 (plasmid) [Pseudonocardia sp. DSM 110487]|uniref:hypothetical protein n=1 Tax=Pseudonocardia sp. DSM 110487 TaxID=2865833 RepID=UPI001C69E165|nr:hypothetical protein [Pseudonocardia sp. DSM 110487]QYN41101.1 hypothetical protein K1T35_48035 [Pseudonocardia sp. DSM 110487]